MSNLRECLQEWLNQATGYKEEFKMDLSFRCLPGEMITFATNEKIYWYFAGGKLPKHPHFIPGVFYVTNYRLVLFSGR